MGVQPPVTAVTAVTGAVYVHPVGHVVAAPLVNALQSVAGGALAEGLHDSMTAVTPVTAGVVTHVVGVVSVNTHSAVVVEALSQVSLVVLPAQAAFVFVGAAAHWPGPILGSHPSVGDDPITINPSVPNIQNARRPVITKIKFRFVCDF